MKYSLRSLMIVVTLICVGLGGRAEYLRRWAAHHTAEANRHFDVFFQNSSSLEGAESVRQGCHHTIIAERYSAAVYNPWVTVDEQLPADVLPKLITGDRGAWRLSGGRYVPNP